MMTKNGECWALHHRQRRALDGKWVEGTPIIIATLAEGPSKESAWRKIQELHIDVNRPLGSVGAGPVTFGRLAEHYIEHELPENQEDATIPKAHSTAETYMRYLRKWIIPRWETRLAVSIQPLEVEEWLRELGTKRGLANPTRDKIRRLLSLVFKHGQRLGFLRRGEEGNPMNLVRQRAKGDFHPVILTIPRVFAILSRLDAMNRTLVIVIASTALRISEILALSWQDIDFDAQCIQVRRAYVYGRFGEPKSEASKAPVPLHPILAAQLANWRGETPYAQEHDFVFPSFKLRGTKPPRANMLVKNIRKAALEVGITAAPRAFGFHTFRRTLASVLIGNNYDPKLVQELLRHSNSKTTLDLYVKAITPAKLEAQGWFVKSVLDQEKLATTRVQ
jgi:integrase